MSQLISANPLEPIQLFPLRYPWAYAHTLQGKRNTWFPEEVPLGEDVRDWELRLTPEERPGVEILLGFFNPMESLVTHNLVLSLYRHLTAPEVRLYLARQIWEEANHTMAFEYVLKTFPWTETGCSTCTGTCPPSGPRKSSCSGCRPRCWPMDLNTVSGRQQFLHNFVGYYIVLEGVFFYGGFLFAYTFRRRICSRDWPPSWTGPSRTRASICLPASTSSANCSTSTRT